MTTTVPVSERLLEEAIRLAGSRTADEVVEEALRMLMAAHRRDQLAEAFGAYPWDVELARLRGDAATD